MENSLNKLEIYCNSFEEYCVLNSDHEIVFNGNEDECISFRNFHQEYNYFDTEDKLIDFFIEFLKEDFLIEREAIKRKSKRWINNLSKMPQDERNYILSNITENFRIEVGYHI